MVLSQKLTTCSLLTVISNSVQLAHLPASFRYSLVKCGRALNSLATGSCDFFRESHGQWFFKEKHVDIVIGAAGLYLKCLEIFKNDQGI